MKPRTKLQGKSKEQRPHKYSTLRDRAKVAAPTKVAAQTERPRDEATLAGDVKDPAVEERALKMLGSPNFFGELLSVVGRMGVVGEQINALVVFIVCVSRLLEKTLSLFVKGPSSGGKNYVTDKILTLIPPSEIQNLTSASLRSWNYMADQLAHKIVYVAERNESVGHIHPTRLLISGEQKLVHWVTVKRDGQLVQERRETQGPIAAISTTTQNTVEVDDETRHISIWIDESPEQTARIVKASLMEGPGLDENELKTWHEVQRLLEKRAKLPVEFPGWFATVSQFVRNDDVRVRRYFPFFLQACKVVALIRSFRLEEKKLLAEGKVAVKFSDFATAALIFNPIFEQSLDSTKQQDIQTQQAVRRISSQNNGDPVSASDLAKELNVSSDRAYRMLREAAASGTIVRANDSTQTNLKLYLPSTKCAFLPEPKELFQKLRDSLPERVSFIHPLTGETVEYRRTD